MLFSAQLLHSLQYAFLSSMFLSLEYMALAKKLAYFLHAPSTYFIRFYNASSSWYFLILSIYCIVFFLFFFCFCFSNVVECFSFRLLSILLLLLIIIIIIIIIIIAIIIILYKKLKPCSWLENNSYADS